MIGKEDLNNEEQEALKVTDKRKFNADGSVRDGVVLEPETSKTDETPIIGAQTNAAAAPAQETAEPILAQEDVDNGDDVDEEGDLLGADIPGADDPASFVNFLSTLASQAAAALGAIPHPVSGQRTVDLETGKYWIDILSMLREKTNGNLHVQEKQLFEGVLGDLQMQFVALNRASEEKLKKQAAQQFSAKDILGG